MVFLELFIRIAGITLLLLISALCLRDARMLPAARFGALLSISLCAVLATSVSANSAAPPIELRYILTPIGSSTAIFIWWFCLALLDDDFRLGRLEWAVAAIWTGFGLVNMGAAIRLAPLAHDWAIITRTIMAVGIVGHIGYVAVKGRQSDLVEERRNARMFIAGAIAVLFLIDLFGERLYGFYYTPLLVNIVQLSSFLIVITWSAFWLLRVDGTALAFEKPSATRTAIAPPALSPKDTALSTKLRTVMEEDKAYLETDLSIGTLATRIGAPEHQLRTFINQTMGHRNFRTFLNGYRMEAAKAALTDPQKTTLPILTIAMDSGFASLASFNRAFKLTTGKTPSQYRNGQTQAIAPDQN